MPTRPTNMPQKHEKTKSSSSVRRSPKQIKRSAARHGLPMDGLEWKTVKLGSMAGLDEGGGMMMLEELDGVDVQWQEDEEGRRVASLIQAGSSMITSEPAGPSKDSTASSKLKIKGKGKGKERALESVVENESYANGDDADLPSFTNLDADELDQVDDNMVGLEDIEFDESALPAWKDIPLHPTLKRALSALSFTSPTEIQKRCLPSARSGRDIIGVAETGSGKTLAYGLPILSHILGSSPAPTFLGTRVLSALILCPTRELALQVVEHLKNVVDQAVPRKSGPPRISIGSVVGGLSAEKQKRIVNRGCDILVATPGRLWDLLKSEEALAASIRSLRFLVIDEADRMIETGHFAELENIIRLTQRTLQITTEGSEDPLFASLSASDVELEPNNDLQTFIFSATLSKDLQQNLKRKRSRPPKNGKRATALEDLVERLDFRDPEPEVVDLSPEGGLVASLKESMIDCVATDKDLYLYYFLLRYPGRSLVFVGSIDGIRRLIPLFDTLQVKVYPLHSQLQQKQRLKNLDRFKSASNGVLIATDVAARGLDIPQVDHVIHFNLPRTADAYVHRSGRTARAQNPGFSLQLCSAEEKGVQKALMKSLGRNGEIPELPIESGFLPRLKERISLAREIEKAGHKAKKENHDRNWLKEAAEAFDVEIDPAMASDGDDPDLPFQVTKKSKASGKSTKDVSALKAELKQLLAEPLRARGVSARYPTSGSRVIVDELLRSSGHKEMLGAKTNKAYDEILSTQTSKMVLKRKRPSVTKD